MYGDFTQSRLEVPTYKLNFLPLAVSDFIFKIAILTEFSFMWHHICPLFRHSTGEASFRPQPQEIRQLRRDAERRAVKCPVIYAPRSELFTCLVKLSQRHRAYLDAAVVFVAFVPSFRCVNIFSAAHRINNSHASAIATARAVASGSTT